MPDKIVLITGATGNIGGKLRAHLAAAGYPLRLLCLNPGGDPDVRTCDLSIFDESWAQDFVGVDTVLHLAADPSPWAGWDGIQKLNLDLTLNVMAAARQGGVRQVVFASSNHVVAGRRFDEAPLTTDMAPSPISPYGASKLFGERVGKMFAERYGLSFIAFRIGACQRGPNDRPGPQIPFGRWGRSMWVSDRDLCAAFEKAIDNESVAFGVYNLMSNNPGMRWRMDDIKRDLGFIPQDGETIRESPRARLRAGLAWMRDVGLRAFGERIADRSW